MKKKQVADRLMSKVDRHPGGCWHWTGALYRDGYGLFGIDGTTRRAHRMVYELLVGPIPAGLQLDHLCRVRQCVNPAHLEPVTGQVNRARGIGPQVQRERHAKRTHCKRGHVFDAENTYMQKTGRLCKTCERERHQRARGQVRAAA